MGIVPGGDGHHARVGLALIGQALGIAEVAAEVAGEGIDGLLADDRVRRFRLGLHSVSGGKLRPDHLGRADREGAVPQFLDRVEPDRLDAPESSLAGLDVDAAVGRLDQ